MSQENMGNTGSPTPEDDGATPPPTAATPPPEEPAADTPPPEEPAADTPPPEEPAADTPPPKEPAADTPPPPPEEPPSEIPPPLPDTPPPVAEKTDEEMLFLALPSDSEPPPPEVELMTSSPPTEPEPEPEPLMTSSPPTEPEPDPEPPMTSSPPTKLEPEPEPLLTSSPPTEPEPEPLMTSSPPTEPEPEPLMTSSQPTEPEAETLDSGPVEEPEGLMTYVEEETTPTAAPTTNTADTTFPQYVYPDDPEDDGILLHERDGGWILDKPGRHLGRAEKSTPMSLPGSNLTGSDSSYTDDEYQGWILEKLHMGEVSSQPDVQSQGEEPAPEGIPPELEQAMIVAEDDEGNDMGEKDGGWILEKMKEEGKGKAKGGKREGECTILEPVNLNKLEPSRHGGWVLDKMYGIAYPPGCDVKRIKEGMGAGGLEYQNMDEPSNLYEKDGKWVLEKMRMSRLGLSGVTGTGAGCDDSCCQDEDVKPFCNIVRSTLVAYDVLTGCDTMSCNECDPPNYPPEEGIISWIQNFIFGLFSSEEENANNFNFTIDINNLNDDEKPVDEQTPPCS